MLKLALQSETHQKEETRRNNRPAYLVVEDTTNCQKKSVIATPCKVGQTFGD
jgi:hypothetical protein